MYLKIESDKDIKSINIIFANGEIRTSTTSFSGNTDEDMEAMCDMDSAEQLKADNRNAVLERLAGLHDVVRETSSGEVITPDLSDREPLVDETFANKAF